MGRGSSHEDYMEASSSRTVNTLSRTERWVNSIPRILRKHSEDDATPRGLNQTCTSSNNIPKPVYTSRCPRSSRVRNAVSQWERMRSSSSVAECEEVKTPELERKPPKSRWPFAITVQLAALSQ